MLPYFLSVEGSCQETIFTLFKNDLKLADECFDKKDFLCALNLYSSVAKKDPDAHDVQLKKARCYYHLKQYEQAAATYMHLSNQKLTLEDVYNCAESFSSLANYVKAMEYYRDYLNRSPGDPVVIQKLWRLNNIEYLFEDSIHFALRPISLNTEYSELSAVPYKDGIIFISNRKKPSLIAEVDARSNAPFYRLYHARTVKDSLIFSGLSQYDAPESFGKGLDIQYHVGPVAFYENFQKMLFTSTGKDPGIQGIKNLQLYFAERHDDSWKVTGKFPYNNNDYSITDPAISSDGKTLYFSSDMEGGMGGKDLFISLWQNDQWTKPLNLGESINTKYDEITPYLHHTGILYFSSNGHPGLGGFDIFKAQLKDGNFYEVVNAGNPLNTSFDDFGISLNNTSTHGYLTSNRKNGGYDDNIYEFEMDIQTYPIEISGKIRYKENLADSLELRILPNAELYLIDNIKNITVARSKSDGEGNFSIVVPYFSKYRIKVIGEHINEGIVSFEIPRYRKLYGEYVIVMVKDTFRSQSNEELE